MHKIVKEDRDMNLPHPKLTPFFDIRYEEQFVEQCREIISFFTLCTFLRQMCSFANMFE